METSWICGRNQTNVQIASRAPAKSFRTLSATSIENSHNRSARPTTHHPTSSTPNDHLSQPYRHTHHTYNASEVEALNRQDRRWPQRHRRRRRPRIHHPPAQASTFSLMKSTHGWHLSQGPASGGRLRRNCYNRFTASPSRSERLAPSRRFAHLLRRLW